MGRIICLWTLQGSSVTCQPHVLSLSHDMSSRQTTKHPSKHNRAFYKNERETNQLTYHNVVIVARRFVVSRIKAWWFKVKVQESQSNTSATEKVQKKSPQTNCSPSLWNSDGPKTHVAMRVAVWVSRALEHSRTSLKLSPTF